MCVCTGLVCVFVCFCLFVCVCVHVHVQAELGASVEWALALRQAQEAQALVTDIAV